MDFHKLSKITIPGRYPMPALGDLLQPIGDNDHAFSTLGLCSDFWQVDLNDKSKPLISQTSAQIVAIINFF